MLIVLSRVKNGKLSTEFHGGLAHQFPWYSMEISPWRIRTFSMGFHGGLGPQLPWEFLH